jgi:hypothetical protein
MDLQALPHLREILGMGFTGHGSRKSNGKCLEDLELFELKNVLIV